MANLAWGSGEEKKGWKGLNDAAINSFNNNIINSFIREMFQNSNDARDRTLPIDTITGKIPPLYICINYKTITQQQFPDFNGFVDIFKNIKRSPPNAKNIEFFKKAEEALGDIFGIKLLIYEDFNTKGLSGEDDDDDSTFSGCVLSEAISVEKGKTAGGSYGIGKNAIFGLSKIRTVLYSSFNKQNEFIFQGIAKLARYFDNGGIKRSDRIFCGVGEEFKSVRNINELSPYQEIFRRNRPGLSQFAVCPVDNPEWIQEFTKNVLRNYWLLLEKGELVVELKEEDTLIRKIEKGNLEELFQLYFNPETYEEDNNVNTSGNPYEFYKCYKNGEYVSTKVDLLGDVSFFYTELENNKTNSIAYLRNDMVVFTQPVRGFGSINYCGVFICDNEEGNVILRDMEPPTHDSFSPERLDGKSENYNSRDGKKVLSGMRKVIRDSLQTIADKYKKEAEDIPWLDDLLLSMTGSAGRGNRNRTNVESENETIERIGDKMKMKIVLPSLKRNIVIDEESEKATGDGVDSGKILLGKHGSGSSGRGTGTGTSAAGNMKLQKGNIKSRIFKTSYKEIIGSIEQYKYKMFLSSDEQLLQTDILISQKGDSGNTAFFDISEVFDSNGNPLNFSKVHNSNGEAIAYRLISVPVPSVLTLQVTEPYKSSFKITKA